MDVTYSTNYNFPLLGNGIGNWGAVWNGILLDTDIELKAAQSPLVSMSGEVVISSALGEVVFRHYAVQS